jgi:two-component system, sensor histidine kinase and response regulator
MHTILQRQLKRLGIDPEHIPDDLRPLVDLVNKTYTDLDADRQLIERSLELSSKELGELNEKLQSQVKEVSQKSQELEKALSIQQTAFDATVVGLLIVDSQGKIMGFNTQFYTLWKIPKEMAEEKDDQKLLHFVADQLKYPEEFLQRVKQVYSNPAEGSYDVLEFTDGRVFERFSRPQYISGTLVGLVWSFHDITKQHQAEKAVQENEKKYQTLLEQSDDVVLITEQDGSVRYETSAIGKLSGYLPQDIIKQPFAIHVFEEDLPLVQKTFQDLITGQKDETAEIHFRIKTKDGGIKWCEGSAKKLLDDPVIHGIIITLRDISTRKAAEENFLSRTREVERMNELMVGREMKMIELKKQIEQLTKELEKYKATL